MLYKYGRINRPTFPNIPDELEEIIHEYSPELSRAPSNDHAVRLIHDCCPAR